MEIHIVTVVTPFETITVHDGDLLVLRFDSQTPFVEKQALALEAAEAIERSGIRVTAVVMEAVMSLEVLDEEEMRRFGWVRIQPEAGG